MNNKIKIAAAGVGNCASSLIQGIHYYRDKSPGDASGLMHWEIGRYKPSDIEVVAAFDIINAKLARMSMRLFFPHPTAQPSFALIFRPPA